jgi:hypothetical protein
MVARIVLLVGSLAACASDRGEGFCAKEDMNQVVHMPEFEEAVDAYFGDERADFYWLDGLISDHVLSGLGGPPNDLERLPGGFVRGSACRAHSCPERAAVIIRCPSEAVAFAVKHFRCSKSSCDDSPTFTIFSHPKTPDVARKGLEEWVRRESDTPGVAPRIEYRTPRSRSP